MQFWRKGSQQTRVHRRDLLAQLSAPLRAFVDSESRSAVFLLAATVVALLWANSPWSHTYDEFWHTNLAFTFGSHSLDLSLQHWVNDGLMALFFFVIGLEVRRELSVGELTDRRRAVIPIVAGIGGMLVPAMLFLALNPSGPQAGGWGIVIGTDTAFMLGALAVVGPTFSTQLRIFLLTLTVIDDIVAVSVIGIVYSDHLSLGPLIGAAVCLLVLAAFSRTGVWQASPYVGVLVVMWLFTLNSGLHASIAGMLGGLLVAAHPPRRSDVEGAANLFRRFRQSPMPEVGRTAKQGLARAISVNERLQTALHATTSYVIVPVFALANAGVDLRGGVLTDSLTSMLTWGVVAGLVAGKFIGIGFGALGGVRLGLGKLPQGVGGGHVLGGAALSGIGFTVSLLIASLAFDDERLREQATVGVLIAAIVATFAGWVTFQLAAVLRDQRDADLPRLLSEPFDPARDRFRGDPNAELVLIEYADFECPFCARATGVTKELCDELGTRMLYVIRHLPLADVHEHAELAARAAEAAHQQGKFWEFHDVLFTHQDELEWEDLAGYASELGLDVEKFLRDVEDPAIAQRIRADVMSAEASGARGTPTFFVNGRRHRGPHDAESLRAALEG